MTLELQDRRVGHPIWSAAGGAAAGALTAVLVLAFVDWRADAGRFDTHVRGLFSEGSGMVTSALLVALVGGAFLGGSFGRLTRHLFRTVPRIVEGAVLLPAVCIVVYAFVLPRYAPHVAENLPFLWSLLGALAFGIVVALVPPLKPRSLGVDPTGDA